MGKGAFRTPVYLFGSTRSGTGKSTLLAHVAVYGHSRGLRTAIIDLNHAFPLQIRNALPRSLPLESYADLSEISQQISPRFRRSFYFTNVDRLSYFPGFKIPGSLALLQDTSYRDFFLQLRGSFDQVFISLPPGIQEFSCLEMFASKRHARESFAILGVLVTTPDLVSLHQFDQLWRERPAIQYLLSSHLLVVANKVQSGLEDHKITATVLTTTEIRSVFRIPMLSFVPQLKEFAQQSVTAGALVLDEKNPIRGPISRLARTLADAAEGHPPFDPEHEDLFHPCLNTDRLARFSPYLPQIQNLAARRLFIPVHGVTTYLEECGSQLRLRLRFTRRARPAFSRALAMPALKPGRPVDWTMPTPLPWVTVPRHTKSQFIWKEKKLQPSVQAVYQFDDRFARSTNFWPRFHSAYRFEFPWFAPIETFRQSYRIAGIMGLLESLGYTSLSRPSDYVCPPAEQLALSIFRPDKIDTFSVVDPLEPIVPFPLRCDVWPHSGPGVECRPTNVPAAPTLLERTMPPPKEDVSILFLRRWKLEIHIRPVPPQPRELIPGKAHCPTLTVSIGAWKPGTVVPAFAPALPVRKLKTTLARHLPLTAGAAKPELRRAPLASHPGMPADRLPPVFSAPYRQPRRHSFRYFPEKMPFMPGRNLHDRSYIIQAPPVQTRHAIAPFFTVIQLERTTRYADLFLEKEPWKRVPKAPPYIEPPIVQVRSRFGIDPLLLTYRFLINVVDSDSDITHPKHSVGASPKVWTHLEPPVTCIYLSRLLTLPKRISLSKPRYKQLFPHVGRQLREQPFLTSWPRHLRCRAIFQNPSSFSLHRAFIGTQRGLGLPFSVLTQSLPRPVLTRKAWKSLLRVEPARAPEPPQPILPHFVQMPVCGLKTLTPSFIEAAEHTPTFHTPRPALPEVSKHGLGRVMLSEHFTHTLKTNAYAAVQTLPGGSGAYFGYTPREEWFHLNLHGFVLLVADTPGAQSLADAPVTRLHMPPYRSAPAVISSPATMSILHVPAGKAPFHYLIEDMPLVKPPAPDFSLLGTEAGPAHHRDGLISINGPTNLNFGPTTPGPRLSPAVFRVPQLAPADVPGRIDLMSSGNEVLCFLYYVLGDKLRHHLRRLDVSNEQKRLLSNSRSGKAHRPLNVLRDRLPTLAPADLSAPKRLSQPAARQLRVKMARVAGLLETAQKMSAMIAPLKA